MAQLDETHIGEQYINGEWVVEVLEVHPPIVKTKVLKPAYKAGKSKNFVASDWAAFIPYSPEEPQTNDEPKVRQKKLRQGQHFDLDIDENGNFVIRDSKGLEILATNIKGPQGNKGDIGPQGPQGVSGADGISIEPRVTEDGERIYFVDGTGKIVSNEFQLRGRPGTDGKTYIPRISEDGRNLYFVNEKGEKISDEILIKGEDGKQGPAGPSGKDGRLWIPEVSKDSKKLRFVNGSDSTDTTPWYEIQGAKGDTGGEGPQGVAGPAGPVFIPSVNADGDLSWSNNGGDDLKNPTPRNIKGDKGDKGDKGATFHPIVKDGVLYWYDDNGNLVKGITPVRITGAQGKQGEQGAQGLSAYQIWLKQGYRGTEQDFLDSLKGEKGSPAPPASFSFKDVEDFTCKVQKIDTNLIVDKDDDTDSPEEIVDKKIKAIADLRNKGEQLGSFEYYIKNWLKEVTWWCAGADRNLLRMCPGDHSKYVGVGTVIIFTALMAFFSSSIALNLVFPPEEGDSYSIMALVCGVFWALMIFFLDRFITNTMYSDGKVTISKEEFFSGLPRIVIAIFLGIVISAPLEIIIFDKEICDIIAEENIENSQQYKNIQDEYSRLSNSINNQIQEFKDNNKPNQTLITKTIKVNKKGKGRRDFLGYDPKGNPIYSQRDVLVPTDSVVLDVDKYNSLQGEYQKKVRVVSDSLQKKLENYSKSIEGKKRAIKDSIKVEYENHKYGLYDHLAALHKIAMRDYQEWEWCGSTLDTILHAWWYYLFNSAIGLIMLLFILIDISPVLYKMMLADGNYDNYLHQEKLLAQDKIRLSLSNMLKKLDDSELKRVAPFIMGDIYEKMAGDSYIYKSEEEFKKEIADQKDIHWLCRIWPISMLRWLFWKEEGKPTAPVIVLNKKDNTLNQDAVINANNEVFEEVLDMKKKIILASYRRWYKTQHDCIICDDVNDENKAREPFEDEAPLGDDSDIHIDDNKESGNWGNASGGDNDFMDENIDEGASKANNDNSEEANTEDSEPNPEDENVSEVIDDDEQELPDDDGDDNPKK